MEEDRGGGGKKRLGVQKVVIKISGEVYVCAHARACIEDDWGREWG